MKKIYLASLLMLATLTTKPQGISPDLSFGNKGIVQTSFGYHAYYKQSECWQVLSRADGSFYLVFEMLHETYVVRRLSNGALDVSYGENGYSAVANITQPRAVLLPDGKIVVGGSRPNGANGWDFILVRFQADGSLDSSFAGAGIQTTDFWGNSDFSYALAVQPDGKLVAAGKSGYHFAIARYQPNGQLDNSFSQDGKDTINFGSVSDVAYGLAIKKDGKIVVAGGSTYRIRFSRISVACYRPDGALDSSFSGDGMDTLGVAIDCGARAVAVQPDGKILLAGISNNYVPGYEDFALVRLNSDGSYDHTFSGDGIQTADFGSFEEAYAIQLQNDGKIVVGGAYYCVARFNSDGSPDNSFSSDGKVYEPFGKLYSLTLQADGKILAAGASSFGLPMYSAVRYNPDGTLDNSLDGDGKLADYKQASATGYLTSAVQTDGKLVAVGNTYVTIDRSEVCVARYNVDGTLDKNFSGDGKLLLKFRDGNNTARAIAIQNDGRIIIGGTSTTDDNSDFALARLNPDGTFDDSFSGDGILLTDFGGSMNYLQSVCIQENGKIIAAGHATIKQLTDVAVARYNTDGTLDHSFSDDGLGMTDFGGTKGDYLSSVFVQPDGKILLVGSTLSYGGYMTATQIDFAIARLNANGTPDLTFNGTGIKITDISEEDGGLQAALQPDGKILLAGYIRTSSEYQPSIVSFLSNGSLDESFSGDGIVTVSSSSDISALALQADQKILAATTEISGDVQNIAIMRFNADGSFDSSFSDDGKLVTDVPGTEWGSSLNIYKNRLYVVGSSSYDGGTGLVLAYMTDAGSNKPPIAGAWFQKYYNPTTALLAAWDSRDPEGGPITYLWEKTAGPAGSGLLYANSASPVVTGLVDGTYTFRLTVTDNQGATGSASVSFTVSTNLPPIAGAWLQKYYSPTSVLLAAWDSHDPEGGPITYFWEKTAGPEGSTLLYWNSASPVVNGLVNGTYTYRLTVTDNQGATGWKELTFIVSGLPLSSNRSGSLIPADEKANVKAGELIVFPNPVKDILSFRWMNEYSGDVMITVMDMSGRKIKDIRINKTAQLYNGSIELTGLKPGRYYLHIRYDSKTFTKPFMKE